MLGTLAQLREEAEALDALVDAALGGEGRMAATTLRALPPALARLVLQRLAGAAGGTVGASRPHSDAILALPQAADGLARPARRSARHLRVRARQDRSRAPDRRSAARALPVPGRVAFGAGELVSERGPFAVADGTLAADALAPRWRSAPWRPGDRMRPLGLGGSKSLQDLFTDRKVPRERAPPAARGGLRRGDRVGARAWRRASDSGSDADTGRECGLPGS